MKKRIVAMVLAGTMVFSQNVYATELPDGAGQTMTEQIETEQQDTNAVETEHVQSEQQDSEILNDDTSVDTGMDSSDAEINDVDNSAEAKNEESYWEEIQQYASDDDDSGVFDEELYKSNLNARKRTLYVGNPIYTYFYNGDDSDGYDITVSDKSICNVTIDSQSGDYVIIRLEPLKPGTISFSVKDSSGKEGYNCDVTVLDNLPEDAVPIKSIELRSWFFARTYYGQDGYISKDEISHLRFFSDWAGSVTDISGLEYAIGLKTIDLSYTGVKDVSPIMKLNNLENLNIGGMEMDDYSWLSNLTKMKQLYIWGTKIQDFQFLNNMPELEKLSVAKTAITNLDFLKYCKNLKSLNISKTAITNLDSLKYCKNLKSLDISDTAITNLEFLKYCKNLESLDISNTDVSDLDAISECINISSLDISGCKNIHNFKPLYNLTNLYDFESSDSQISDNDKLEIIRSSIEKKDYLKGDSIRIPSSYNILYYDHLHIDVTGGDKGSIAITKNDSYRDEVVAKDKGNVELTMSLGNASVKTSISIKDVDENPETGDNNNKEIMDRNTVDGISDTILINNGDLWRVYPETKKIRSNVRKYVSKWIYTIDEDSSEVVDYSLDNNDDLWSGNKKIQSNIKDVDGHYAITNDNELINLFNDNDTVIKGVKDWTEEDAYTIIYKEDGSLWWREEVGKNRKPADWKKIDDHVVQYGRYRYLTQSGDLKYLSIDEDNGDYYCTIEASNVAMVNFDEDFYYGNDGNCYLGIDLSINIGNLKIKKWHHYNGGVCILTEDNKLYIFNRETGNKQLISDGIIDLGDNICKDENGWSVQKVWVKDSQGTYYYIDEGVLSKTDDFNNSSDGNYTRNGVVLLTNVKYTWSSSMKAYALRTDGTVWDVTDVPKMLLDLGQSTVEPGDVDGDSKVTTRDLMIVLYGVSGRNTLTDEQVQAADIDGDGKVSVSDLTRILYYVSGRNTTL
ncbi:MAG: leucine-rich repeat domain-containing protein [[Eubacterium] rectale]|nr:leucine-rich repeat domain-containing protein [Agathobacter rectalis]